MVPNSVAKVDYTKCGPHRLNPEQLTTVQSLKTTIIHQFMTRKKIRQRLVYRNTCDDTLVHVPRIINKVWLKTLCTKFFSISIELSAQIFQTNFKNMQHRFQIFGILRTSIINLVFLEL